MVHLMKHRRKTRPDVLVAGFGSPHGDDQVGWRIVSTLGRRPNLAARVLAVYEATQLVEELRDCRKLIVVDACRTGGSVGTIARLRWPDPRIARRHSHSTHGVGVCGALQLAERLGRMPADVEIIGVEVRNCEPGPELSSEVLQAMFAVEELIFSELCEVVHA